MTADPGLRCDNALAGKVGMHEQSARIDMAVMGPRKARILRAIVTDYVKTSRPVGSERLLEVCEFGCKPATIRNEMAEMGELGYLAQPHLSAGRIPTDLGYRFYVDELMDVPNALGRSEIREARSRYRAVSMEIEKLIVETCRILSALTSYTSLATAPSTESATVRRVYLTGAGKRHVLLVALLSTGHVEHSLVEVEKAPPDKVLVSMAGYLSSQVAGSGLREVGDLSVLAGVPAGLSAHASVLLKIGSALAHLIRALSDRRVFVEGAGQLLRQPEFQDVQRLECLLDALQQTTVLYGVLSKTLRDDEVTAIIGAENGHTAMRECSVVVGRYSIGDSRTGYVGVLGPTRMNYDRATAAVGVMARNLSRVLTQLNMA